MDLNSNGLDINLLNMIKRELKQKGLDYQYVANQLKVSQVTVKRLLNGQQSIALERLQAFAQLIELPLSELIRRAEEENQSIPTFTSQQDALFCHKPALFTLWTALSEGKTLCRIQRENKLEQSTLYLMCRELETVDLISLGHNDMVKLTVPTHTAFAVGANFPIYFVDNVLLGLHQRVRNLQVNDSDAFLVDLKLELTQQEFEDLAKELDEKMFELLAETQRRRKKITQPIFEYTFGLMGAKGAFHGELPDIHNYVADMPQKN